MVYHNSITNEINYHPESVMNLIYGDRMRTLNDKNSVQDIFNDVFGYRARKTDPLSYVTERNVFIGEINFERGNQGVNWNVLNQDKTCLVLKSQLDTLRSLLYCVKLNWMAILVSVTF